MNRDAVGAVGEILGATAVVISLVYLAAQIKAQNRESRLAAIHEISVAFRESVGVFTSPDISGIFVRANADFDELQEDEIVRLIAAVVSIMRAWEEAYKQHKEARLDAPTWDAMVRYYGSLLNSPGFARVWEIREAYFDDSFRSFVQALDPMEFRIR